mmetsp:Transcript_15238/g.21733  ORF Transcript_15238/g.21733 Transcript_15238/m.21733 type:complete len:178 (-) Transcript_15238:2648-3181(-)
MLSDIYAFHTDTRTWINIRCEDSTFLARSYFGAATMSSSPKRQEDRIMCRHEMQQCKDSKKYGSCRNTTMITILGGVVKTNDGNPLGCCSCEIGAIYYNRSNPHHIDIDSSLPTLTHSLSSANCNKNIRFKNKSMGPRSDIDMVYDLNRNMFVIFGGYSHHDGWNSETLLMKIQSSV